MYIQLCWNLYTLIDTRADTNLLGVFCILKINVFLSVSSVMSSRPPAGFRRSFRLSRRDKKTNKSMYESKKSEMYDMADVPTYEEVTSYRRQSGAKHRLVVLVGE